ncbi:MAG TPA: TetR/AcrR family transcriptional regulator [Thermotogota bacterium]|nr:TetR/AcrR family transcriptional regulator [Thermotogota bacterium]HPJ87843.1 TetR/AcrR family transcriptional regulator [Thermotogota bacterium]HPR96327.1 TetR/AcrR family transcriptional regulator [Thermotogota bacterium]
MEKTLELIKRQEGASQLNLRKIAKELECAHTNIYNYFSSYNDLIWSAAAEAMMRLSNEMFEEETVEGFVRRYVSFAFENKGYYKLIWYENFQTEMPDKLKEKLGYPSMKAAEIYALQMKRPIEEIIGTMHIAFAYTHGMLTMYLNNRIETAEEGVETYKENIIQTALSILLKTDITGGRK